MSAQPSTPAATPRATPAPETAKDTLISIIIAFALAFVFRGFVIEAFVIPTGSMAPTLMGAHMKFRSPESGYEWPVDPWRLGPPPDPSQYPSPQTDIQVTDPMSGEYQSAARVPLNAGDRILVLKYLYTIQEPERFDVIVFKNPTDPAVNYIKRLIGLPGEQIALVDGDVFVRKPSAGETGPASWESPGWTIARKPLLSQRAVWQPIFDAAYAPLNSGPERTPFSGLTAAGWTIGGRSYSFDKPARTELFFDESKYRVPADAPMFMREHWTLDDRYAYDQKLAGPQGPLIQQRYPVSDLRLRAGIEPKGEGLKAEVRLEARRHEFIASISGTTATLSMRPLAGAGVRGEAKILATATVPALRAGVVSDIEFWHVDQSLSLLIDGTVVAKATYEWSPAERIQFATGLPLSEIITRQQNQARNSLSDDPAPAASMYQRPSIRWVFEGAPVVVHRPAIDRDLFYQPAQYQQRLSGPALATSPVKPLLLKADEFFACGDNSPASLDGRLWDTVDPWVEQAFHPPPGIVPRDLLLGRAFFVYWPSLRYNATVPVPDFGRMRFIW